MTLNTNYAVPWDPANQADVIAIDTSIQFAFSWYMDPLAFGKYPDIMVTNVGVRLPVFTQEQSD